VLARGLAEGGRRQHDHAHRADEGHGGRNDRAALRAHREHHLERGEGPDRGARALERREERPHRLRRGPRARDRRAQRHDQQPAPRALLDRPAEEQHRVHREGEGQDRGRGEARYRKGDSRRPLRHARGVRRALRLSVQRPGGLHHRPEFPDRRRHLPRHVLKRPAYRAEHRTILRRHPAALFSLSLLFMILYAVMIFLSAFLLFQVQPLIAKMILPWFGGSAAVWTVCMLFFQVLLLLGYLYAHWSIRYLRPRSQTFLHIGLLAASLLMLPAIP